jgi:hypothetical protein
MPAAQVRGHTRKKPAGGTAKVRPHVRRRGLVSPRHSWKLTGRAVKAARRDRKAAAFVFGGLAVVELAAWLTVTGAAFILFTAAVLAGGTAFLAARAGGLPAPGQRGRP